MRRETRYLFVFIGLFVFVLGAVLALNLLLGERGLGSAQAVREASAWQQATRGVTFPPPVTQARAFKAHRWADQQAEVNTLVLGASSLMGVTQAMFPADQRLYNFSLTANATPVVAAEAEYFEQHAPQIRHVIIGLDWAIGMIYLADAVPAMDLSPAATLAGFGAAAVPWTQKWADALSAPKVKGLVAALRGALQSAQPLANLRQTFFELASADYRCADGVPARDYDVMSRGQCLGFRHDGSWTFAGEAHLTEARAQMLARAAAAPSAKFSKYLCSTGGEPNAAVLRRLGSFALRFTAGGGNVVFMLTPLVPGMEQEMLKVDASRRCLEQTKSALDAWARAHGVTVIDAGASENFGCVASEFLDENHAWPDCHARILARYQRDFGRGNGGHTARAGLYRPALGERRP